MKLINRFLVLSVLFAVLIGVTSCGRKDLSEVRIGSLKGPTSIGLLELMKESEEGTSDGKYSFDIEGTADVLTAKMVSGELDIALLPANVASVLYNKTNGNVEVIDINTLGVLYMVSADSSVQSIEDLKGRTVVLSGMGTTPDMVLLYLLSKNGISDEVTLDYRGEPSEVAAVLEGNENFVGLLPQPYVTSLIASDENMNIVLDMTKEWEKVTGNSLVTGVTVVRKEYYAEHKGEIENFLKEHEESVAAANNPDSDVAFLSEKYGIIGKETIAKKAIPYCNVTYVAGPDMKEMLEIYLGVLYDYDPSSVGGNLPGEDFY